MYVHTSIFKYFLRTIPLLYMISGERMTSGEPGDPLLNTPNIIL